MQHSFAADLQLQMSAPPDRISELLHSMQSCICDVNAWATANILRLNDNNTGCNISRCDRQAKLTLAFYDISLSLRYFAALIKQ